MLRTMVVQLVAERASVLCAAAGAMVECLTSTESICLEATGSLEHRSNTRVALSDSLTLACAESSTSLICDDIETDARLHRGLCHAQGVRSLLAVSKRWHRNEVVVLSVVNGTRPFTETDRHALEVLMELLSATLLQAPDQPARVTLTAIGDSGYQQVLDAIADMVLVKGPRSRIVWANKAFRSVYGMSNEQLRGIIDADFAEPDITQKYVQDDARVFATGQTLDIPDEPIVCSDGELRSCHTVKSAIRDAEGKVAMTVAVMRDITERKRAEHELTSHRERLEVLVRERTAELEVAKAAAESANRAKSAFLANMSHELRTPMHAVLAYSRLCINRGPEPKMADFLTRIVESGERLLGLLNELLDLSKLQAGKMPLDRTSQDVEQIAREVALELEPLLQCKRLALVFERASGCESCVAPVDRKQIARVFTNILSNAVRFSTEAGRLAVRFSCVELAGDQTAPRSALEIAFSDEGVGIPPSELESIFDEFVQSSKTRTNAGGTGLGLAICREIVALHGGTVRARNNELRGATFLVSLPLQLEAPLNAGAIE